jgi:Zn-dependent protease
MPPETGNQEQNSATAHTRPAPDSDVEAEIRRQIMAERAAALQASGYRPGPGNPPDAETPPSGILYRWKNTGGILGALASFVFLLLKLKSLLFAFKFFGILKTLLITGGSMFVSMWAYASAYGWGFGAAMVLMIFIHECGHAFAGHLRGKPWGIMMFIPFMGAFVTIRGGKDAVEDAFIGIAGPIVGTLAGLVTVVLYTVTKNPFWLAVSSWCFMINLFNLLPVAPLDGGWIVPLFSPRILALTAVLLLPLTYFNPMILVLAAASLPRIISGWNAGKRKANIPPAQAEAEAAYFRVTRAEQWRYGMAYVGLIAFLATAVYFTHDHTISRHPQRRAPIPIQLSV